jgi:GPH family glycoside/pentoside/hexuronide:cation symporter
MIACYFFIWYVPGVFKSSVIVLFWYLVVMNLLLRTTYTIFVVPYTALSFEIVTDYADRSKIQGIRSAMNMAANLLGCAMAWTLFFGNNTETIRATNVAQNYINMGTSFSIVSLALLLLMLNFTKCYIEDSRAAATRGSMAAVFCRDMKQIILDPYPRWVFIFIFFVLLGIVLVSSLQMYVFEDFMVFSGGQKTVAHGATMVGMGIGSLFGSKLVRRFDKKGAICIGVVWSVFCELVLAMLFLTEILKPEQRWGGLPISFIVFSFLHGAYWLGNGIMMPVSVSMMADVSEIHEIQTGVNKDGSYAAMYSLATKISMSIGLLVSGYGLSWAGYISGADVKQPVEVIWRICALTLVVGPLASLMAMGLIFRYPVTKQLIETLRGQSHHGEH